MSYEIRTLTLDELPASELIAAQAFGSRTRHDNAERAELSQTHFLPEWSLGVFDAGEMTSMMRILPEHMWINGGALSIGVVSPVANSPLHRRKGHSGAMMRRSLEVMRERGQVLSGLYTPHPAFYRRYGWEIASEWRAYKFAPKDLRLQIQPSQRGSFRFVPAKDWQTLRTVYDRYAPSANGSFQREEYWWKTFVADSPWHPDTDVVVWQNETGVDEGYAVYQQPTRPGPSYENRQAVEVRELIATSRDAYLNLWAYFGRHDIHESVTIVAAPHEPVFAMVADSERLEVKQGYAVLLRVVDFEAAMQARSPACPDEKAGFTLRLLDESAPWNDGAWRVDVADGKTLVQRTASEPEMVLTAPTLAPIFNGYLSPRAAASGGLIEASDDALARAERVFAVKSPPYFVDHF